MRAALLSILAFAAVLFVQGENMANGADDNALATAKAVISKQVEKIKANDVEGLRGTFTERAQGRINEAGVKKAADLIKDMTIDDLVGGVQPTVDSIKIKMKNGRTLTTLLRVAGEWKADTVWFR
jgi:hypothetical protein